MIGIGSIVKCVSRGQYWHNFERLGNRCPVVESFYTVRELYENAVRLEEIINPKLNVYHRPGFIECAFKKKHFREIEFPPSLEREITESLKPVIREVELEYSTSHSNQ